MRVLLTGASGFLGRQVHSALLATGHEVRAVRRVDADQEHPGPSGHAHGKDGAAIPHPHGVAQRSNEVRQGIERTHASSPPREGSEEGSSWVTLDMAMAHDPRRWLPLVTGCDAVVNAVGLFRESRPGDFDRVHTDGPQALFEACVVAGVRRVVQVSALGADAGAVTPFHRSKHAADAMLLALPLEGVVVQPSLIYGPQGQSSRWFLSLASLPLFLLPDGGRHRVQPIHVDDAVEAILGLLEARHEQAHELPLRLALVGPEPVSLADYLQALRAGMGLAPARVLRLPDWLTHAVAAVGDRWPDSPFDRDSLRMLRQGNTAPARPLADLLGRAPRAVERFLSTADENAVRTAAQLRWLLPLLRVSLAAVWIVTAFLSAGLYPVAESRALLAQVGVPEALQLAALYGAAAFDLMLGVLTLWPVRQPGKASVRRQAWRLPGRRWLWRGQAVLMLFYMGVIAWALPAFWLHPFGPLLKNLPMLALLVLLDTLEPRPERKR